MSAHRLFRLSMFRPDAGDYPAGCAGCGARAIVTAQTGGVRFVGDMPDECPGGLPEFRIGEPTDWKSGSSGNPVEDIRRMLREQAKGRTQ